MNRKLVCGLALAVLTAAAPLLAQSQTVTFHIPILDPAGPNGSKLETKVFLTTEGTQKPALARFLLTDTDGTKSPGPVPGVTVVPGQTFQITSSSLVQPGQSGLLELTIDAKMRVEARVEITDASGVISYATVPVVSHVNRIAAGKSAQVLGLERIPNRQLASDFGLINLGSKVAQCTVKFFRADSTQVAGTATLQLHPLSLRYYDDAFNILGETQLTAARSEVSCSEPFFPFGVVDDQMATQRMFVGPAAAGDAVAGGGDDPGPGPTDPNADFVFTRAGLTQLTGFAPAIQYKIPVPRTVRAKRVVIELDIVPGPWNSSCGTGAHNIAWFYRGRFRSNTIMNTNAISNGQVRNNQNIDLPAATNTNADRPLKWEQGKTYHVRYTYNAAGGTWVLEVFEGAGNNSGTPVQTVAAAATAKGGILEIPTSGVDVQHGHYFGQHCPEVAWPGTRVGNVTFSAYE